MEVPTRQVGVALSIDRPSRLGLFRKPVLFPEEFASARLPSGGKQTEDYPPACGGARIASDKASRKDAKRNDKLPVAASKVQADLANP